MSSSTTPKITLPGAAKATPAKTAAVAGDKATAARVVKPGSERYKAQELIVEHELIADCEARGDERHIREVRLWVCRQNTGLVHCVNCSSVHKSWLSVMSLTELPSDFC